MTPDYLMVFDVESVGLQGEGFSVAWVVIDDSGVEHDSGYVACPHEAARGSEEGRQWILKNVVPHLPPPTCDTPREVRDLFWSAWRKWSDLGAEIYADHGWPVEARFLIHCVEDDLASRTWTGPFPLHEISTIERHTGYYSPPIRRQSEYPKHHPLNDARYSARCLLAALNSEVTHEAPGSRSVSS